MTTDAANVTRLYNGFGICTMDFHEIVCYSMRLITIIFGQDWTKWEGGTQKPILKKKRLSPTFYPTYKLDNFQ